MIITSISATTIAYNNSDPIISYTINQLFHMLVENICNIEERYNIISIVFEMVRIH